MYAIAGVTGHTGAVVAETLIAEGHPVRVIVRDATQGKAWKDRGAEVAVADLGDAKGLTRALTGAKGAYVLLPPVPASDQPVEHNRRVSAAIAEAVSTAALPHVVLLSSVGAQHEDGTGPIKMLHHLENELAATTAATTFVRAAYFMENWGASLGMLEQGTLPTFTATDVAFPQVATRDIGRTAAVALIEGPRGRDIIELAGPRELSPNDIAAALADITGKPVTAQLAPLDAVVPTFTQFGISTAFAELYREMYQGIADGLVSWAGTEGAPKGTGAPRLVRGTVPIEDVLGAMLAA
jgi:uncharacterized protein YbjT (DUF2867 family)